MVCNLQLTFVICSFSFLEFLTFCYNSGEDPKIESILNMSLVDSFFQHLNDTRNLASSTRANYANSLVRTLIFMKETKGVDVDENVKVLRRYSCKFKKEANICWKTQEELKLSGKWLTW